MSPQEHAVSTVDTTMAAVGSKATYAGATTTVGAWFLSSEFGVLMGVLIGIVGVSIQWYYKHKLTMAEIRYKQEQNEREKEAHERLMGRRR
jgi:hypothetical protein